MPRPDDRPDAEGASRPSGAATAGRRSRSLEAWGEFLHAVQADTGALIARLRKSRAARPSRPGRAHPYRPVQRLAIGILAFIAFGALALSGAMLWALKGMPAGLPTTELGRPAILLEAADGTALGRVGPLRAPMTAREDFPKHVVQAVLSIEDRRFYYHFGIDPIGIGRAMRANAAAGGIVQGGSTITQQLMKIQVGNDQTYTRKLREGLRAIWLELSTDKDEILTSYLNTVYMGGGAHGFPAAARLYFGKNVSDLSLAEAAMLAGMIKAPSKFNPLSDPQSAQARADLVVDAMLANEAIDQQTAADAKARPATLRTTRDVQQAGSWFADWVAQETASITGPSTRRVRVQTTLSPKLQQLAERVISDELGKRTSRSVSQAALVALRPDGAVLAMVGGRDYGDSQFNRATEAKRHPGSAFKLFVYAAALRSGRSLNDTIDASPVDIKGWRPDNFGNETYGRMPLADAFARSVNTAAVRLALDVGLDKVIAMARDLGIDASLRPVPSLALGATEVSLLDLTGAFASVRADRKRVEPWGISAFALDDQQRLRTLGPHAGSETLGQFQKPLVELLRAVVERGTGRAAALNEFAAGKTGTSQNHRDAWFVGFTEKLVVGVWVGNDDNEPMDHVVGGTLPATIWKRFVSEGSPLLAPDSAPAASPPVASAPTPAPQATNVHPLTQSKSIQDVATELSGGQRAECDYRACANQYQSFRASDCSYQPYSGPRAICTLGAAGGAQTRPAQTATDARATEQRPSDARSTDSRPTNARATEQRPTDTRSTDSRASDTHATEQRPTDAQETDSLPTNARATEQRPIETQATD